MKRIFFYVALALVLIPASGAAQDWSLHVTPSLGYYTSDKALGVAGPDGTPVRLAPSTMVGLSLELWTGTWWGLRLSGETSFGGRLEHAVGSDAASCSPSCTRYEAKYEQTGEHGNLLILGVQGVIRPVPSNWLLQPYMIVGGGVTRYELPKTYYGNTANGYNYGGREASFTAQGGVGLQIDAGPGEVTIEAIDNISGFVGENYPSSTVTSQIFGPVRHDLTFGLGYRLRVH